MPCEASELIEMRKSQGLWWVETDTGEREFYAYFTVTRQVWGRTVYMVVVRPLTENGTVQFTPQYGCLDCMEPPESRCVHWRITDGES